MRKIHAVWAVSLASSMLCGCASRADKVAIQLVKPANIAATDHAGEVVARGQHYLDDRQYGLAISQFREALRLDAESAAAHNGLAIAYVSIGRPDLARRHFELAIAYGPANATYQRNYARLRGVEQADAGAMPTSAEAGDEARGGAVPVSADGSWPLSAVARQAPSTGGQGPVLVEGAGTAMLLSRPGTESRLSLKTNAAEPAGQQTQQYSLFVSGRVQPQASLSHETQPVLKRTSLYEVRLITVQPARTDSQSAQNIDGAPTQKYSASFAEASFWAVVARASGTVDAKVHSSQVEGGCAGMPPYVPRWSARPVVRIRQCSA